MAEFNDVLYKSRTNIFSGAKNLHEVIITQPMTHDSFSDNLVFLTQIRNLDGSFHFDEVQTENLEVHGKIDDVDWDSLLNNVFLKHVEQTIMANFTFNYPTSLAFLEPIVGDQDASNGAGYLNDQMVEALLEVEDTWSSLSAAKLSAQVEANILCQHVNNINQAYQENRDVDFYQLVGTRQTAFEGSIVETEAFEVNGTIFLAAVHGSKLELMHLVDTDTATPDPEFLPVQTIPLETSTGEAASNPRGMEVFHLVNDDGTLAVGLAVVTDDGIVAVRVSGDGARIIAETVDVIDDIPSAFSVKYAEGVSELFVASQWQVTTGSIPRFRIRIHTWSPTAGSRLVWEGAEYSGRVAAPRLDLLRRGAQLHLAVTDALDTLAGLTLTHLVMDLARAGEVLQLTLAGETRLRVPGHEFVLMEAHGKVFLVVAGGQSVRQTVKVQYVLCQNSLFCCSGSHAPCQRA